MCVRPETERVKISDSLPYWDGIDFEIVEGRIIKEFKAGMEVSAGEYIKVTTAIKF